MYLRNHSSTSGLDDESSDPELSQNPGEGNPVPEGEELERKDGLGCWKNELQISYDHKMSRGTLLGERIWIFKFKITYKLLSLVI